MESEPQTMESARSDMSLPLRLVHRLCYLYRTKSLLFTQRTILYSGLDILLPSLARRTVEDEQWQADRESTTICIGHLII